MSIATVALTLGVPAGAAAWAELRYALGKKRAARAWREEKVQKLSGVGTTSSLAILPLVDWFVARPGLEGEAGVSFLVKTDENTILLDVGLNFARTSQSLPRILARTAELFDEPIYGIVGGLHYPYPRGRWRQFGLDLQQLLVYGPFRGPRLDEIRRDMRLLEQKRPKWVSISAHDSSDEMIEEFRRAFGESYHVLRVGECQAIAELEKAEPIVANAG